MSVVRARSKTSEWFTSANPILRLAEIGLELDTGKFKMGDGVTYWNDLSYVGANGGSQSSLLTATFTAVEIAARWDENSQTSYIESDMFNPGDIGFIASEQTSTLDNGVTAKELRAYIPDQLSADVGFSGFPFTGDASDWDTQGEICDEFNISSSAGQLRRLKDGCVVYFGFGGIDPPTTGEVTVGIIAWRVT